MLKFEKFILENGLKVIVHEDTTTPLVAMNILYDVGARDEDPARTGFAHLFEHLMFGGSVNIPNYDEPLQLAGGENNAFTNNDITNYYLTIPYRQLETAFWLESDRMMSLAFSEKSLEVQRSVVVEEFKQRYLNQPYGDVWLELRPLAFKVHPYRWATIGREVAHIQEATLEDVIAFFGNWYGPNNAILSVAGNCTTEQVKALCEKWFAPLPRIDVPERKLPVEPEQTEKRELELRRKVPGSRLYIAWHCVERGHKDYYATDLLSDVLSRGKSARLYQRLVKEHPWFTDISAYVTGDIDRGLFVIEARLVDGVTMADAERVIWEELEGVKRSVSERELEKVKHKAEASLVFSEVDLANRALNLAYFELLGDASESNRQAERYNAVTAGDISRIAGTLFTRENCSVLRYVAETENII